ncbi:MAG: HesB/IscA family protein [Gammaproteobacteria bacterium]
MFKVTKSAARQIRDSATQGDADDMALRIAPTRAADGAIEYTMGFDEVGVEDTLVNSAGVDVVFRSSDKWLLNGTTLDYVEIEPGQHRFIFLNPNDPHYRPPTD